MDSIETATVQGTIHGNTIELERDLGLPDGESVTVVVRARTKLPRRLRGNRAAVVGHVGRRTTGV